MRKVPGRNSTKPGRNIYRKRNYRDNDANDRKIAAQNLVNHIVKYREGNNISEDEVITLVGHSHGGNVAIQAAKMLKEQHGLSADLITIATPAYNSKNSSENPMNKPGIDNHVQIYNTIDGVQGGLAGEETFYKKESHSRGSNNLGSNGITKNIEVDASEYYGKGEWLDAHSFDNNHMEGFLKEVNENWEGFNTDKNECEYPFVCQ